MGKETNQMKKQMDVDSAIEVAKSHVRRVFRDEDMRNLGLEEVEFDDDKKEWIVTVYPLTLFEKNNQLSEKMRPLQGVCNGLSRLLQGARNLFSDALADPAGAVDRP